MKPSSCQGRPIPPYKAINSARPGDVPCWTPGHRGWYISDVFPCARFSIVCILSVDRWPDPPHKGLHSILPCYQFKPAITHAYLIFVHPHIIKACKKYTKKCVNLRQHRQNWSKWAKIGQNMCSLCLDTSSKKGHHRWLWQLWLIWATQPRGPQLRGPNQFLREFFSLARLIAVFAFAWWGLSCLVFYCFVCLRRIPCFLVLLGNYFLI